MGEGRPPRADHRPRPAGSAMSTTPPPPPPPPPGGDDRSSSAPSSSGGSSGPPAASQWSTQPGAQPGGPEGRQRNSMAVTALVLGLIAFPGVFVIAIIPVVNLFTVLTPVVAVAAVIVGIVGIRRAKRPRVSGGVGMSLTGIILGAVNLLGTIALIVAVVQFLDACPGLTDAGSAQEFTDAMVGCAEEQGWMTPEQTEQFREQLEQQGGFGAQT